MPRTPKTTTLSLGHYSLQFSDTVRQKRHDARVLFQQDYDGITGTETGSPVAQRVMRVAAHNAGYTYFVKGSNWVSIKKALILPGTYRTGYRAFVDREMVAGPGADLHVAWAQFETENLGQIALLASHYATKGRPDGTVRLRVNLEANETLAKGIGGLAEELGAGAGIVFYGGDQNIIDRNNDTFFGEDLTSVWDELETWENTGHGNVDVIASYDKDGRVAAEYARTLDDKERFMYMDHYPVEAGFKIKHLKR